MRGRRDEPRDLTIINPQPTRLIQVMNVGVRAENAATVVAAIYAVDT
jgi:hypothetical protein